ncbi:MAG: 16S rRNA (guanine(527)-N(7))-methyltransferase RsmG [Pseudomonadota bacterium]
MSESVAGVDVSRETFEGLEHFADLVRKWTQRINLISPATLPDLWNRHICDSAQLYTYAPDHFGHWVDLGSGGGFPGIVLAIIAAEHQPDAEFTLIESDQRKATFLRTAKRELGLNITVHAKRIADVAPSRADVVTARALSPLPDLLGQVAQHMHPDGSALLPKGRSAKEELAAARASWSFALEEYPSFTDPDARLLKIQRITPLGA